MSDTTKNLWNRYQQFCTEWPEVGLSLDLSRAFFNDDFFTADKDKLQKAFKAMAELEAGAEANPDEKRMVGHYWLRNAKLAPKGLGKEIEETLKAIKAFAKKVHAGEIRGACGPFKHLLLIGIGGSALGPQFVSNALESPGKDPLDLYCLDNTDPDGIDKVLAKLSGELGCTLSVVISKSGGTKETRNGMVEAQDAYARAGLLFAKHAVAITQVGSQLDKVADEGGWIAKFPMWDWVGGRTSETSAVGLLPAALQGFDIDAFIAGAKACDELTRQANLKKNPAAQLALSWFKLGEGKGTRAMVVLPYKDRLELFSKYLQQLVMESLGKELDANKATVNQGLTVYGNKGSTDQHAYVQQLRDGLNNFFVTFIQVLQDRKGGSRVVEGSATTGDYLMGFLLGTRRALADAKRPSLTITVSEVSAFTVGLLIALFERSVGLYATLININAYHQPGVEAGKKAAEKVLKLQNAVLQTLGASKKAATAEQLADTLNKDQALVAAFQEEVRTEDVFDICRHLATNGRLKQAKSDNPFEAKFNIA